MGVCVRWCRLIPVYLKRYWIVIAWCIASCLVFYFEYYRYKREPQYYYLRTMLGLGMCFSRGSAAVLNMCSCLLVLPMCRRIMTALSSLLTRIRITPQDNPPGLPQTLMAPATHHAKSTHLMLAFTLVIASVMHTGSHIANAINFSRHYSNRFPNLNQFSVRGENPAWFFIATIPGVTGVSMVIILMILVVSSSRWARRRNYDAFYYTHALGVVFLGLMLLHPLSGCLKEQSNINIHYPGCRPMHASKRHHKVIFTDHNMKSVKNITFVLSSALASTHLTSSNRMIELSYEPDAFPEPEAFPEPHYDILEYDEETQYEEAFPEPDPDIFKDKIIVMKQPSEKNMDVKQMMKPKDTETQWKRKRKKKKRVCKEDPVFVPMHTSTWRWVSVALMIWSFDWLLRWWSRREPVEIIAVLKHTGCDVMELTLKQPGFSSHPGQFVLLQCPQVSRMEWHPFTVTSLNSAGPDTFTIYMRTRGDWTSQVGRRLRPLTMKKDIPNYKYSHKEPEPPGYVRRLPQNRCLTCHCVHSPNILTPHSDIHNIYEEIQPIKEISKENLPKKENFRKGKLGNRRPSSVLSSANEKQSYGYNDFHIDKMHPKWHYPTHRRLSVSSSPAYLSTPPSFNSPSTNHLSLPTPHHSFSIPRASSHSFMSYPLRRPDIPVIPCHLEQPLRRHDIPVIPCHLEQPLRRHDIPVIPCHLDDCRLNRNRKIIYDKRLSRNIFYKDNEKQFVNDSEIVSSSYGSVLENHRDTTENYRTTVEKNKMSTENVRNCDIELKGIDQVFNNQHKYNKEHVIHMRSPVNISIYVDGPFSSPSSSMLSYPIVMGTAGGVGITPLAATLNHILMNNGSKGFVGPRNIHVVWVARDARLFLSLAPLLVGLLQHCWENQKEDSLELRLHLTTPTPLPVLKALFVGVNSILLPRIIDGRPVWKQIFKEWKTHYTGTPVGVFACGPKKMCRQVKRHCMQAISLGAKNFSYHQESFS